MVAGREGTGLSTRHSAFSTRRVRRGARDRATKRAGLFARRAVVTALALGWLALASLGVTSATATAVGSGWADFFTFLDSAARLRHGQPLYTWDRALAGPAGAVPVHPNLNHPAAIALLLPLLALSPAGAFTVWTALGFACYLLAAFLVAREVHLPLRRWYLPALLALVLTLPGTLSSLQLGQYGLVLALPIVLAWLLLRRGRRLAAGLLLGVLIALKPFLAPLLAVLVVPAQRDPQTSSPLRSSFTPRALGPLLAALLGAAGLSLAALPLTGARAYLDWLATLRRVNWYTHELNVSLIGLLFRTVHPTPPSWVAWPVALGVTGLGLLALTRAPRAGLRRADRDLSLLLVLSLLGSPLGWLYYTPLLLPAFGTLVAAWPLLPRHQRWLALAAGACLWVPYIVWPLFPASPWAQLTLRATPTYGLLALALALGWPQRSGVARWQPPATVAGTRHGALPLSPDQPSARHRRDILVCFR